VHGVFEQLASAKNIRFVLYFSQGYCTMTHRVMKLMEIQYGICTQHINGPLMNDYEDLNLHRLMKVFFLYKQNV
jgi:hypothetical protein